MTDTRHRGMNEGAQAIRTGRMRSGNLHRYLHIVRELAIADFRLKYHDSALGYVWSMLNPLLMFVVYYFVFTRIFSSTIPDFPLFLLVGIISYAFFQDTTFSAMSSLYAKSGIMKKIYFPRVLVILASSVTCILSLAINMVVLFGLVFVMKGFSPMVLLTPVPILLLILFSMGMSFYLAILFAYFRDVSQIWGVLVLALFWLSPIVFNVETLPPTVASIVYFNPLARIFVLIRHYLLYSYFDLRFLTISSVYSIVTFVSGYLVFRRYEPTITELF